MGKQEHAAMVDALTELRSLRERWVRKGQRVLLPADKAEGTLMEVGKIVSYDDASETFVVQVDAKYRQGRGDDGLREVMRDQMRLKRPR
jgi:hypothetical protein